MIAASARKPSVVRASLSSWATSSPAQAGTNPTANRYYAGLYTWKWAPAGNSCFAYTGGQNTWVNAAAPRATA